jgi:outer membrane protein assembly factor BamB
MRIKAIAISVSIVLFLVSAFPTNILSGTVDSLARAVDSHGGSRFSESRSAGNWWPMFRHDPTHTGYSTSTAPSTNETLWNYTTNSFWLGGVDSSPAVADGMVFIGSNDGKVYALNASTGALAWTYTTNDAVFSSPAVADGMVFVGSDDGKVYALNETTGNRVWSYTTGTYVLSSPAVADGMVFVGSENYKVYALNETTGNQVWSYTTDNYVESSPAVADGMVFVGSDDGKVYALNETTGNQVWSYRTGSFVRSSPCVADGMVFIGSNDGKVYALNASTGALAWTYTTNDAVFSSPAVADGMVFVGSDDGKVYALNETTGNRVWSYTTGNTVFSSPAVADGIVFVGPSDDKVYALNASTGAFIWSYTTGYYVSATYTYSSPAVADGIVFVGSKDGKVYAFCSLVHDVTVTNVTSSQPVVGQGYGLNMTVTAANLGDYQETLKVTVYANSTPVASQNVTLSSGELATTTFTWNTTGFACGDYVMTAYVWPVPGETDTADNTLSLLIRVGIADLATTELTTPKTVIGQGFSTPINVTVTNQGDHSATSNVTVYANETVVITFQDVTLASGNTTTLTFTWNATVAKGNYTMSAYVQPVPFETNTSNNNLTSPVMVRVGMPSDVVAPFGVIDMKDIAYVAKRFSADQSSPTWDANADFDSSGKVDMKDIALVAKNFGKHDP